MALKKRNKLISLEVLPATENAPRRIQYRYREVVEDGGKIVMRGTESPGTFNETDVKKEFPVTQEAVKNMRERQRDKKVKKKGEYKKGTDILADAGVTLK